MESLPESYEQQINNYKRIGLNDKLSIQIFDSKYKSLFEKLVKEIDLTPNFIAAQLTETLINLSRNGVDISKIKDNDLELIFLEIQSGVIAKESFEEIIQNICNNKMKLNDIITKMKDNKLSDQDIEKIIKEIIIQKKDIIEEKGQESFSILMGEAMKKLRGKVDGKKVSDKIRELLNN